MSAKQPTIKEDGCEISAGFRIRKITTKKGKTKFQVDLGRSTGKHIRKSFDSIKKARGFAATKRNEVINDGIKALNFTEKQKKDATQAITILEDYGITLKEAAHFYVKNHRALDNTTQTNALVEAYLEQQHERMIKEEIRPRSYEDCVAFLKHFKDDCGHLAVDTITPQDVDAWLDGRELGNTSRAVHRRYISIFFNWCVKRGATQTNPVKETRKVKTKIHTPQIYSPTETASVLKEAVSFAQSKDVKKTRINGELTYQDRTTIVPYLSIAFFAGVRPNELMKLKWRDIDLNLGEIHINADTSKTSMARIVHIQNNLKQFLVTYRKAEDEPVFPYSQHVLKNWRTKIFKDAKVKTIQDGARHTFATYHLAMHGLDDTLEELGHTDPKMLFRHYRGLAKNRNAQAKKFFNIAPKEGAKILNIPAAKCAS